jgi:hypothetical protein
MSDEVGAFDLPQAIATTAVDPSANLMNLRTFPPWTGRSRMHLCARDAMLGKAFPGPVINPRFGNLLINIVTSE